MTVQRSDNARAREREFVKVGVHDGDFIKWHPRVRVDKFDDDQVAFARQKLGVLREPTGAELLAICMPYDVAFDEGNAMTRQGLKRLIDRFVGTASVTAFSLATTTARIGVGDDATANTVSGGTVTNTDLVAGAGSTHRQFVILDSAPTVGSGATSGVMTCVASFTSALANYAWNEWGMDGGASNGTTVQSEAAATPGLINRRVPGTNLGTKTSGTWVFTATITIT